MPDRTQPNILLIMADQLTPLLCGAYGHRVVQTPQLSALVEHGVRFDAAYTPAPVCAPARACLLTGTHTATNRVYDNAAPFAPELPTLAHYLTNAGYDCVLSGKMHFVGPDQLHGFRCRLTTDIYPEEFTWVENRAPWALARDANVFRQEAGVGRHAGNYLGSTIEVGRWHHHLAYDEEAHFRALEYLRAVATVRDGVDDLRPFFLCVSYHHPHDPFWPPQDLWDLYEGAEIAIPTFPPTLEASYSAMDRWLNAQHGVWRYPELREPESLRRVRRAYYASVTYIDRKVGELCAMLRQLELWKETVVVFLSDHGDMLGDKGMVQKRSFYEMSSRVPLIMRFPDERFAGTAYREPVSLVDLLPTVLDVAGVPTEERLSTEGTGLLGLLDGADRDTRTVFAEMHVEDVPTTCFMARRGAYKYIYLHNHAPQLFNLEEDPEEQRNLAADPAYQQIGEELRSSILERFSPDAIEADVQRSLRQRCVVNAAMARNGTRWDYAPAFDPNRDAITQYLPTARP